VLKGADESVLNNYLALLAHSAQERNSDHALLVLKIKNEELSRSLEVEKARYAKLLSERLDDLDCFFASQNSDVQVGLSEKVKNHLIAKTVDTITSPLKSVPGKLKGYFDRFSG